MTPAAITKTKITAPTISATTGAAILLFPSLEMVDAGDEVGRKVGIATVGATEGDAEGDLDGAVVITFVGDCVGALVGDEVVGLGVG